MKDERLAILRMLENGVISVEEAERLLALIHENAEKKDISESIGAAFQKAGSVLENIVGKVGQSAGKAAKVVGEKAEKAKPEIKKAAKTVAEKVSETAENIKQDINKRKNEKDSADYSDFVYEGEAEEKSEDMSVETTEKAVAEERTYEKPADISQFFDEKDSETEVEPVHDDGDDDRDYEAEFYQMMRETNGGDIFGDVYTAMDNLREMGMNATGFEDRPEEVVEDEKPEAIAETTSETVEETVQEDNKTDKE